jgi:hypothetical protein
MKSDYSHRTSLARAPANIRHRSATSSLSLRARVVMGAAARGHTSTEPHVQLGTAAVPRWGGEYMGLVPQVKVERQEP